MADNPVWDEEEHELRVMKEKCDTCIYGPNSIILAADTRNLHRRATADPMGNIVCHKTIKLFIGEGKGAICHGHWLNHARKTIWGRLAVLDNVIRWWTKADIEENTGKK